LAQKASTSLIYPYIDAGEPYKIRRHISVLHWMFRSHHYRRIIVCCFGVHCFSVGHFHQSASGKSKRFLIIEGPFV
jgi:hypothetical protein